MEPPLWAWIALIVGLLVFAAIDMLVFARGQHEVRIRTAALWSLVWIALGLASPASSGPPRAAGRPASTSRVT